MRYVVTFDHWTGTYESICVVACSVGHAVEEAMKKANKIHNHNSFYLPSSVVSVVRVTSEERI